MFAKAVTVQSVTSINTVQRTHTAALGQHKVNKISRTGTFSDSFHHNQPEFNPYAGKTSLKRISFKFPYQYVPSCLQMKTIAVYKICPT